MFRQKKRESGLKHQAFRGRMLRNCQYNFEVVKIGSLFGEFRWSTFLTWVYLDFFLSSQDHLFHESSPPRFSILHQSIPKTPYIY
jgi:hypothetical protein